MINYLNNIRVRRGEFQFFSRPLNCYSISGHENAVWQIPINSSFNSTLSVISPYRSVLHITSSSPEQAVETFVCRSSNNFSSSVIITNSKLTFIYLTVYVMQFLTMYVYAQCTHAIILDLVLSNINNLYIAILHTYVHIYHNTIIITIRT